MMIKILFPVLTAFLLLFNASCTAKDAAQAVQAEESPKAAVKPNIQVSTRQQSAGFFEDREKLMVNGAYRKSIKALDFELGPMSSARPDPEAEAVLKTVRDYFEKIEKSEDPSPLYKPEEKNFILNLIPADELKNAVIKLRPAAPEFISPEEAAAAFRFSSKKSEYSGKIMMEKQSGKWFITSVSLVEEAVKTRTAFYPSAE